MTAQTAQTSEQWLQFPLGGDMSDLYVLTVWKNGWAYAAPYGEAEVPEGVIDYSRAMTREEALRAVLDAPIGAMHGSIPTSKRSQFRA